MDNYSDIPFQVSLNSKGGNDYHFYIISDQYGENHDGFNNLIISLDSGIKEDNIYIHFHGDMVNATKATILYNAIKNSEANVVSILRSVYNYSIYPCFACDTLLFKNNSRIIVDDIMENEKEMFSNNWGIDFIKYDSSEDLDSFNINFNGKILCDILKSNRYVNITKKDYKFNINHIENIKNEINSEQNIDDKHFGYVELIKQLKK